MLFELYPFFLSFGVRGNNGTWAFRELKEKLCVISEFFSLKKISFIPSLIKFLFFAGIKVCYCTSYCFDYWKVTSTRFSCEIRKPRGKYHTCPFGYRAVYHYAIILVVCSVAANLNAEALYAKLVGLHVFRGLIISESLYFP